MRRAIALLQPTLFEGGPGGGAVADALALGVRCIVSDIETNLEIENEKVSFFHTGSPNSLAEEMMTVMENHVNLDISNDQISKIKENKKKIGEFLVEMLGKA